MTAVVVVEPITVTAMCEAGQHGRCRGMVLSLTGDRACECPECRHQGGDAQ